jgi:hypothetical protein
MCGPSVTPAAVPRKMIRVGPTSRPDARSKRCISMPAKASRPGRQSALIDSIQVAPSSSWKNDGSKPCPCRRIGSDQGPSMVSAVMT